MNIFNMLNVIDLFSDFHFILQNLAESYILNPLRSPVTVQENFEAIDRESAVA